MKQLTIGILAHVDAGKTTLSEGILYSVGAIRRMGRVDNQDAFLDHHEMERDRGITIFSKQAVFEMDGGRITLLDTPGHVDFSAEMERTLRVLDYAVLVVSAADGVQSHTETLWQLFRRYDIPVFLFVNKMDQPGTDRQKVLSQLQQKLSANCTDFGTVRDKQDKASYDEWVEAVALCDETLLEKYLETGEVDLEEVKRLIWERQIFPVYFGSALKMEGVTEFLEDFWKYTCTPDYRQDFAARVFKITRDEQGNRLTHLKVLGGVLKARQLLEGREVLRENDTQTGQEVTAGWSEKVNQIRIYNGDKYESVPEAVAGTVCAVTGLSKTTPQTTFGLEDEMESPVLEPVLTYRLEVSGDWDTARALPLLRQLEEEEPELHVVWEETTKEIHVQLMGEVQIDVIKKQLWERYRMEVTFSSGNIVYKETIANPAIGIGHFEPLRHYAEVHLLLEPGEPGSGLVFGTNCSEDLLAKNWQRLILTHLEERNHKGVLTRSSITDMKISIIAGKAHTKHTEGGDFRQATYRAVRQGLRGAVNVLLEPYYFFTLTVPANQLGRAMTDVERMYGKLNPPKQENDQAVLTGIAPVATMREYWKELSAYTSGLGKLSCQLCGYRPCHNAEEVILERGYDPDLDLYNTADSVFCSHGSGYVVPWTDVPRMAHVDSGYELDEETKHRNQEEEGYSAISSSRMKQGSLDDISLGEEEIQEILGRAYGANKSQKKGWTRKRKRKISSGEAPSLSVSKKGQISGKSREKYLLVDGYNIVFAWPKLKELAQDNIDSARSALLDILCNYQGYTGVTLICVFDAYRVKGSLGQMQDYHNIHVVYTKEAETADQYIEKLAHKMGNEADVTVATSDGIVQLIIRSQGCRLWSARDFMSEIERVNQRIGELI